ncbi:hypothetical protein K402DRAFT_389158 [Aulographum hederae CBS 113979]|uniref:Zn(2)-C6 fungal-type domain-containing protein n=1 Tax=Aulographum hederae CBS 113979 TaxID=1176131 RepID=A0A6G1HCI9_9PEZI|nr:hypothetical protein K402DRAFT_389158 [Aulographum hederae CBS 113979]
MSRVQIGTLPRRSMSNQPRELMNCKSCRKRKIKCNRLRPTCEACRIFQCPCVYDAVPKRRGPKTDVIEALLKRVDGLEKRFKDDDTVEDGLHQQSPHSRGSGSDVSPSSTGAGAPLATLAPRSVEVQNQPIMTEEGVLPSPNISPMRLIDTYFARFHDGPFHIFDENTIRRRHHSGRLSKKIAWAMYAASARFMMDTEGLEACVIIGNNYARRARLEVDADESSIENVQTLLLLCQAVYQDGKGKKAYMILTSAISMALALNLHMEAPPSAGISMEEQESRRLLFWSCYLMDRFAACGSRRPCLIPDDCIALRLPSLQDQSGAILFEGDFFSPNLWGTRGVAEPNIFPQNSHAMLIGITRILGTTNQYLASGGAKGDSHFPWHSLSMLSRIRQDLDIWATGTQGAFTSMEGLFGRPDSTVLALSKLIYHLIYCLIYRPFLPLNLMELSRTGQHQSWQIEATNLCFFHANAISDLVEIGHSSATKLYWPAFVAFCICTAGTIHVHGAYYEGNVNDVFSASGDLLGRGLRVLVDMRRIWAGVQHQIDTLRAICNHHRELLRSHDNGLGYSPVFTLDDFFIRYTGIVPNLDGAFISFADIAPISVESPKRHAFIAPRIDTTMQQRQQGHRQSSTPYTPNTEPPTSARQDSLNSRSNMAHLAKTSTDHPTSAIGGFDIHAAQQHHQHQQQQLHYQRQQHQQQHQHQQANPSMAAALQYMGASTTTTDHHHDHPFHHPNISSASQAGTGTGSGRSKSNSNVSAPTPSGATVSSPSVVGDAQQQLHQSQSQSQSIHTHGGTHRQTSIPHVDERGGNGNGNSDLTPAAANAHHSNMNGFGDPMLGVQVQPSTSLDNHDLEIPTVVGSNDGGVGGGSGVGGAGRTAGEGDEDTITAAAQSQDFDPFLRLLEQLAENDQARSGPSELDYFLSGGG